MSKSKVNAVLEGYDGPIFPDTLDKLNKIYDRVGMTGASLEQMAKAIRGFEKKDSPTTKDGYNWLWGLHFKTKKGMIVILFPWYDYERHDVLQLDRSIAVYTRGIVDIQDIQAILGELYSEFAKITQGVELIRKIFRQF